MAAFDTFVGRRERPVGPVGRVLVTLGRVPLFYYLLQWPVTHMAANLAFAFTGQSINWFVWPIDFPAGSSFSLPVVYAMWVLVVVTLYFPSKWFRQSEARRHRDNVWLRLSPDISLSQWRRILRQSVKVATGIRLTPGAVALG